MTPEHKRRTAKVLFVLTICELVFYLVLSFLAGWGIALGVFVAQYCLNMHPRIRLRDRIVNQMLKGKR